MRPTWPGPRRIAHRGGGTLAPENTLAAMREGVARGYRAVEFDVMLTADDVPIVIHDPAFGRTIAGRGDVAKTSYADLATRDAGGWFDARFAGEPVPRYADVFRFCGAHGVWTNVEIKPSPGFESQTGRIVAGTTVALLEEAGATHRLLLSSFSVDALAAASVVAPHLPRGLLVEKVGRETIDVARSLGCISVGANQRRLDAAVVARLHAAGFAVLAYTVDDPDRVVVLDDMGVDALFVDRIDLIPFA